MAGKAFPREHSERVCRGHGVVCDSSGRQRCRLRPKNKQQKQRKQWLSGAHASSDSRACRNAGEQTTSTAAREVYGKADRVCSAKRHSLVIRPACRSRPSLPWMKEFYVRIAASGYPAVRSLSSLIDEAIWEVEVRTSLWRPSRWVVGQSVLG